MITSTYISVSVRAVLLLVGPLQHLPIVIEVPAQVFAERGMSTWLGR